VSLPGATATQDELIAASLRRATRHYIAAGATLLEALTRALITTSFVLGWWGVPVGGRTQRALGRCDWNL